jgi:hypothetical protein
MHSRQLNRSLCLLLAVAGGLGGCTSQPMTAEKEAEDPAVIADAPLGSRIKRRSDANPVSQANRQQFEQERVQQGAIQTGIVNKPN